MPISSPSPAERAQKPGPRDVEGVRVNIDGTLETVTVPTDADGSHFRALTNAIGADLFDIVGLPDNIDVFVDDEGLYRAEYNPVLSNMVRHLNGLPLGYRLHGAGVFLSMNDEGDTISLTPAQRATVTATWFAVAPLAAV